MNLGFAEKLLFNTVRIEATDDANNTVTGTSFLFEFSFDGKTVPCLVTNKHVVESTVTGTIYFHTIKDEKPDYGNKYQCIIHDFENQWLFHPHEDVDLCIMFLAQIKLDCIKKGVDLLQIYMDEKSIISAENLEVIDAIDDIIMVGYPNGIWDDYNNLPICRRGITATHPNIDYQNRKEFMIDAACFPGSSGSPVFYYKPGSTIRLKHDEMPRRGNILALMGVLYAGPQHFIDGEVVIRDVPTKKVPYVEAGIPNNLGVVIKAARILDFKPLIAQILSPQGLQRDSA